LIRTEDAVAAVRFEGAFGTAAQDLGVERNRKKRPNNKNKNGRERITGRHCCFFDFTP
jgi:hypothetical protein